ELRAVRRIRVGALPGRRVVRAAHERRAGSARPRRSGHARARRPARRRVTRLLPPTSGTTLGWVRRRASRKWHYLGLGSSSRIARELLNQQVGFWQEYHEARVRYLAGERNVVFPEGTYWFKVHFRVRCRGAA